MEIKDRFFLTNTHKPNSELKVETRVLNFEQMNKTLGLDVKKPNKSKTEGGINNTNSIKTNERHDSDNTSFVSQDSASLDDLKYRLKICQEKDNIIEKEELLNLGIKESDILPGEYINDRYDGEILINGLKCNGLIVLTNYRLLIFPINEKFLRRLRYKEEFLMIPYLFIEELSRTFDKKQIPHLSLFEIVTKDFREIKLKFIMDEELTINIQETIYNYLYSSIYPQYVELYALQIAKFLKKIELTYQGWKIYSIEKEYQRQGALIAEGYDNRGKEKEFHYRYLDNSQGKICSTYPMKMVVPTTILDDFLLRSANFRSRERIPVLSFSYLCSNSGKRVGLWRSSQCKTGLGSIRCFEDEALLKAIGGENEDGTFGTVKIYDARPYLNAVANKVNGKGYEDSSFYKNTEIKFLEIPNIHKVRDAYKKIKWEAPNDKIDIFPWIDCISKILTGTAETIQSLKEGYNVLIHCSDGWDRTSQIVSLAELSIDPYFRTIEGFFVLIEKDWVYFGHKFALRCGHSRNNVNDQKSQIFIQFLDCVHQLYHQYPLSFEFTPILLLDIAHYLYSCYFGTFLMDTILDREKCKFSESTVSLWSYLLSNKEKYLNPFYKNYKGLDFKEIKPMSSIKVIRLWKEHFLEHSLESCDHYNIYQETKFPDDNLYIQHQNLIKENEVLKKTTNELLKELNDAKELVEKYKEKYGTEI